MMGKPESARRVAVAVTVAVLFASPAITNADEVVPSNAEMWQMLQQQQKLIEEQRQEISKLKDKLEAAGDAIEQVQGGAVAVVPAGDDSTGNGEGVVYKEGVARRTNTYSQTGSRWWERTTIGSYGEMHYNNLENRNDDDAAQKEIDFHRFVLFVGHEFTDRIRLFSEIEIEHALAGDDQPGEVEVEQAFIEWDFLDDYTARGGLFLIPVGILNETHEPNTFYGVERNNVEKNIIPTTWWEGGIGATGRLAYGISADLALTSGLKMTDFNVRGGRQKVAKADASHGAVTGRVAWRGYPGLEIAVTGQFQTDVSDTPDTTRGSLFETHVIYNRGMFGLRALYAQWNFFSDAADVGGKNKQYGFYVEPAFKPIEQVGIFGRFSQWDNAAGDDRTQVNKVREYDIGLNYWPIPNVVLKFDYQWQDAPSDQSEYDGFNLGIGYSF